MSSQSNIPPLPSGTPPPPIFGGNQPSVSFSDLARKGQDVMSSTLQQYGPVPMSHPVIHQTSQSFYPLHHHQVPVQHPHIQTNQQHAMPTHYPIQHHQQYQHQQAPMTSTQTHIVHQHQPQPQPHQMQAQQQQPQYQIRTDAGVLFRPVQSAVISAPTVTPVYQISPISTTNTGPRPSTVRPVVLQPSITTRPTVTGTTSQPNAQISSSRISITASTNSSSPPLDTLSQNKSSNVTVATNSNVASRDKEQNNSNNNCAPSSSTLSIEEPLPPKKEIMQVVRKRCEEFALNELIQEYRDIESDMSEAQRNRDTAERNLNEYVRQARGQVVEHQPKFKKLKQEKTIHSDECKEFSEALKYVSERLDKRFGYKISQMPRSGFGPMGKRAARSTVRMGTTPPIARPIKKPERPLVFNERTGEEKRTMLDLKDGNLWCRDCDVHYSTFREYCDHMHKREHLLRYTKPTNPPWRSQLEQLNRKSSFDSYKSICHKLADKLRYEFNVQDMDQALNPALRQDPVKLKQLSMRRERGDFPQEDTLFTYKGYDMLIPITGYYCKLCNRTLCDFTEVDHHLKSYEHNSEHAKSIALNPAHERIFRQNLEKSYKEQHGVEYGRAQKSPARCDQAHNKNNQVTEKSGKQTSSSFAATSAKSNEPTASSSNVAHGSHKIAGSDRNAFDKVGVPVTKSSDVPPIYSANLPFRQPYKKPTSKIVDEHDVVADKFEKRDVAKSADKAPERTSATDRPDGGVSVRGPIKITTNATILTNNRESIKRKLTKEPQIVPLNGTQPSAALKRLRSDGSSRHGRSDNDASKTISELDALEEEADLLAVSNEHADDNSPTLNHVSTIIESSSSETEEDVVGSKRVLEGEYLNLKRVRRAQMILSDSDECDDVEIIKEVHLEKGHKDSPFPELELAISGNVHYDTLKDSRLAMPLNVKLNKIDMNDYKHMLLSESTIWSRVNLLMTKKESNPSELRKDMKSATRAKATYFDRKTLAPQPLGHSDSSSSEDEQDEPERRTEKDEPPFQMGMLENFFCDK